MNDIFVKIIIKCHILLKRHYIITFRGSMKAGLIMK